MKTAHTPAPWSTHGQAIYSGKTYVAQCWDETSRELPEYADAIEKTTVPDNAAEAQANARLIAAAPELLAMIQRLLGLCELNMDNMEDETREAIDDAEALIADF